MALRTLDTAIRKMRINLSQGSQLETLTSDIVSSRFESKLIL